MEKINCINLMIISFLFYFFMFFNYASPADLHTYIVHVHPNPKSTLENWHSSFLPSADIVSGVDSSRLIYSYSNVVSGFAARLTGQELKEMEKKPGFVAAYPDQLVPLLTTRSPGFLGLDHNSEGLWMGSSFGKGVIVAMMDTGIYPSHPSFQDNGLIPAPPSKWKGSCQFNSSVCNNKLIGAKNFVQGLNAMKHATATTSALRAPPDDDEGHGTHTASTAAGMFVDNANVDGQASGTASGIAPFAHLAIYKVCGVGGCATSDILAGMDAAISDGVDIMSLSLGGASIPFYRDTIAIGAFAAVENGIFVSCAGGNNGPSYSTLSNEAPWILTVGASTLDRNVRTTVTLDNGLQFNGESLYQPSNFSSTLLPLVYPGSSSSYVASCSSGSFNGINVTGKIVLCDDGSIGRVTKGTNVKNAGGAGMIIAAVKTEGYTIFTDAHVLPASVVSYADGLKIKSYINSTSAAKASITFKGTIIETPLAPTVAYFSSRGPNRADRNVLKPDIIGPGLNILAAWPFDIGTPSTKFNLISGTSMSTPHLTGVATLLKSSNPDWSPAAIKSAIMTTASLVTNNGSAILDQNHNTADFFAIGAGHVDPTAANDPGLIYDLTPADYIPYLCGLNYSNSQVSTIVQSTTDCANYKPISGAELNYPSFMVSVSAGNPVKVSRTVTNVGAPESTYSVQVIAPVGVSVAVEPNILSFSEANNKAQFSVTFTSNGSGSSGVTYAEGYLTWLSDDGIAVNSPIMAAVSGGSSRQSM